MKIDQKILSAYKYLCIAIFCLVALGGAVRAMNAGLSCPDWPLCFGDIIPDYHPEVYFEFIHRVLAGIIGIVTVYLNYRVIRFAEVGRNTKIIAVFTLVLLFAQIIMGGLTVLLHLHEKVVALHLSMGTGFFALMLWLYLTLKFEKSFPGSEGSGVAKNASVILLLAVYGQIILGGLVASHYAALVCTDFPLCHGEFIPTFSGIIGLHVIHRLGAYALAAIVVGFVIYVHKHVNCVHLKKISRMAAAILLLQIVIGISNVLLLTPPLVTVLHLAVGTMLLGAAVYLLRVSTFQLATRR
jgi:heme a synthase